MACVDMSCLCERQLEQFLTVFASANSHEEGAGKDMIMFS